MSRIPAEDSSCIRCGNPSNHATRVVSINLTAMIPSNLEGYSFTTKGNKTMATMKIVSRKCDLTVQVEYLFPESVAGAVSTFGEEVVLNRINRQFGQELRATVLRQIEYNAKASSKKPKKGKEKVKSDPQGVATKAAADFEPTLFSEATRATKTIFRALDSLTEAERTQVLEALNASGATGNSGDAATAALA